MTSETKFSTTWKASIKPKKQRLYRYNAPHHLRGHFLNVHMSKELRKKYHKRAVRVRKGDKVVVIRGQFRGKSGTVARVDLAQVKVYVDGVEHQKRDGTKSYYPLTPNHLVITDVDSSDKRRVARLEPPTIQSVKEQHKPSKQSENAEKIPVKKTR